jgi:hypothetical protein
VSCNPSSVTVGSTKTIKCTVHVKGYSPTGTVTLSQSGTGSATFAFKTCALVKGSCSVSLKGTSSGTVTVLATYGGDLNNKGSSGTATVTINS